MVVVVDRTELEGQLAGWVERLLGEMQQQDIAVWARQLEGNNCESCWPPIGEG